MMSNELWECYKCGKPMDVIKTFKQDTEWGIVTYNVYNCKSCDITEQIFEDMEELKK